MIAIEPATSVNAAMLDVGSSSGAPTVPPPGPQLLMRDRYSILPPLLAEAAALALPLLLADPPALADAPLALLPQPGGGDEACEGDE